MIGFRSTVTAEIMSTPPLRLDGKVVLITGSTSGLGRGMASGLGALGARVAMSYAHDAERAERAFAAYREAGGEGILVRGSVIEEEAVDRVVGEVERALGAVDVLVLNATPPQPLAALERADWSDYQAMLDYFIKSPYLLARRVLPAMKARGAGRIINIGTELLARGVRHTSAYATAKAAQHGWTRAMALELAPHGITVNTVSPGWIPVERHASTPPEVLKSYRDGIPMGRLGTPDDVCSAVAYLASDAAGFVTGQHILVDGGRATG